MKNREDQTGLKSRSEIQRGPERPRQDQRDPGWPRDTQGARSPKRFRESQRGLESSQTVPERLIEAQRGPDRP